MKKTGNKATYYARSTENIALSVGTAKPVLAVREHAWAISEHLQFNELEIIYANIRV